MLYRRLTLSAPAPKTRDRFAHPVAILGLIVTVVVALVSAFPLQRLSQQLLSADLNQSLAERYLMTLLKADPDYLELRLALVNQLILQKKLTAAIFWLERAPKNQKTSQPYQIAHLDLALAQLQERISTLASSDHSSPTISTPPEILTLLKAMRAAPLLAPQIKQLAAITLDFGEESLAWDYYQRLFSEDVHLESAWLAEQAKKSLGKGHYRLAANLYFLAQKKALLAQNRLDYLQEGIKTLQSGNFLKEALMAGQEHGQEFFANRDYLIFMIRLALSANEAELADQLSQQLMRFSWLEKISPFLQPHMYLASTDSQETSTLKLANNHPSQKNLTTTFDQEAYELAYQAFLANRNVSDAYRVALSAVQQLPNNTLWRERLAQVAEWSNKPQEALEQWLWLAEKTKQELAWQGIARLAPGLFDLQAMLLLYQHQIEIQAIQGKEDPKLWSKTSQLYESLGDAEAGLAYLHKLEHLYQKHPLSPPGKNQLLQLTAELALRMGKTAAALNALQTLRLTGKSSEQQAIQEASLLYSNGRLAEAYQILLDFPNPSPEALEYWQIRAELGRLQGDSTGAIAAYQTLHEQSKPRLIDTMNLVNLLARHSLREAAAVAESGWHRTHHPTLYLQALNYRVQMKDWHVVGHLLTALEQVSEGKDYIENQLIYWQLKGAYLEQIQHWPEARLAWEKALSIAPNTEDLQTTFLWLLIQQKDWQHLQHYLARWRSNAENNPSLMEVFTSAYYELGQYETALRWAQKQLPERRQDFLWLLYYADLLDRNHQQTLANRLRAAIWQKRAQWPSPTLTAEKLSGLIRLALVYQPGDMAETLLRQSLRQDGIKPPGQNTQKNEGPSSTEAPPSLQLSVLSDLALGYWLSQNHSERTTAWLMSLHSQRLVAPTWAQGLHALQTENREILSKLIEQHLHKLPLYDRIYALQLVGQTDWAQDLAFTGLEHFPLDDQLHLQLFETSFPFSHRYHYRWEQQKDSIQTITQQKLALDGRLNPSTSTPWQFRFEAKRGRQNITNAEALLPSTTFQQNRQERLSAALSIDQPIQPTTTTSLPSFEQRFHEERMSVRHQNVQRPQEIWDVQLNHFCRFSCQTGANLHYQTTFPRLLGGASLEWREPSQESTFLKTFGQKNTFSTQWNWRISKREHLAAQWEYQQHYLVNGPKIGSGQGFTLEAGHRLRTEYPDLTLRAYYTHWRFKPANTNIALAQLPLTTDFWDNGWRDTLTRNGIDPVVSSTLINSALQTSILPSSVVLPTSSQTLSFYLGLGHQLQQEDHYSKAWRPLFDLGIGYHSISGLTWSVLAGISGSLFGTDLYTLYWLRSEDKPGNGDSTLINNTNKTNTFGFQYTYSFSR